MSRIKKCFVWVVFFMTVVAPALSFGQFAQRGGVEGIVTDSTGAVVPGTTVTLLDLEQKATKTAMSDATGHYSFPEVTAGTYQVTASHAGFETTQSGVITVNLGRNARYDLQLKIGAQSEQVTVDSSTAVMETGQANLSTNVTEKQFEQLPLNGRNFTSVAALSPGISTQPQANLNPGGTYSVGAQFASGGVAFTTGGVVQGSRDNGFYVNGVNITDNYETSLSYEPSVEALSTGTLQVADFSAANGHDFSTLSMQTKGGTSTFHGQAYDFIENDALNAINPFTKSFAAYTGNNDFAKPTLRRNQFGGGIGGPVFIPKILEGLRNKAFFFANYENFIESDGAQPVYQSVPSAAERTGDFSELLGGSNPLQLYNPFFTTYDANGFSSRPVIPNNRLDQAVRPDGSSVFDPASKALMALYPLPNISGTPSSQLNYVTTQKLGFSVYHFDSRFDLNLTSKDNIFVTYSKSHGDNNNSGNLAPSQLYVSDVDDGAYLVTVNYARVFTPNLVNEFIFGIGDSALQTVAPNQISFLNSDANPFNQVFQNTGSGITRGVLQMIVDNYASPGFNQVFRAENKVMQFSDNVSWSKGRHTMTFGGNYFRKSEYDWDFARFVEFQQKFSTGGSLQNYEGGDAMADLAMGLPETIHQRYDFQGGDATSPELDVTFPYWGFYANDKFAVTPRLTLTVGLRYDLSIPLYANNNLCCAIYQPTTDGGVLKLPGIAQGVAQHYLSATKKDFAPRVSFAYNLDKNTVLRAGYAIFYDVGATQISTEVGNALNGVPGYFSGDEITNVTKGAPSDTPVLGLSNIFQTPPPLVPGNYPVSTGPGQGYFGDGYYSTAYYYDQKSTPLPYYQRFMLDVQHEITPRDSFTLSYLGSQGRKGSNYINENLPAYQTNWPTKNAYNNARPNNLGRFGDIYVQRPNLNAFYNAAVAQFQHQFTHGLQFLSNYTWGKTVSDYPYVNTLAANGEGGFNGFQDPHIYNRGESTLSHRHRFVYSGIWSPTYGQSWNRVAREALTDWRASFIGTIESGEALTIINDATSALDYAGTDELFVNGDPNLSRGSKNFLNQFNTAAFTIPVTGVRGNSGLGTIRGPGQNNLDLSLAKTFPIFERFHAEFRADAYNALNHTQWNGAQTYQTKTGTRSGIPFGAATNAREARILQLAVKLAF
ncbi:TonB-dependent receptor [Tunturiibacter gelidoferens]|uniref:Uncharacterized protein n=1 Tax=Tunturiibacter gelidiferens TaxID=3069689 RepID=A0ACC5P0Q8_9BACT|nr:TonB-dependent receptor [Edaphobacter lichenicola]MBB5340173.1 hypothetical protein [Edaphobacter lichenicola]